MKLLDSTSTSAFLPPFWSLHVRLTGTWHYGLKMNKKDLNELKSYKKDLNELKNHIADYQAFTKDAVKSVFDKLSEMEDFKRKTVIHQVAIKKEMGLLQDDVEAMKAKLSETFVFLDTISTKLEKLYIRNTSKTTIWWLW